MQDYNAYVHFYTTNINEIGTANWTPHTLGCNGYTAQGIQCHIHTTQEKGTVPFYRYYNGAVYDHFYTTNPQEIGSVVPGLVGQILNGYTSQGIIGYCYLQPSTGTVPLYPGADPGFCERGFLWPDHAHFSITTPHFTLAYKANSYGGDRPSSARVKNLLAEQ